MKKKHNNSDFGHGMVAGTWWAGLSTSETADFLGTVSRVYTKWCVCVCVLGGNPPAKKKTHWVTSSVGWNALVKREVKRKWPDWLKLLSKKSTAAHL